MLIVLMIVVCVVALCIAMIVTRDIVRDVRDDRAMIARTQRIIARTRDTMTSRDAFMREMMLTMMRD